MRASVARYLLEAARVDERVFLISGDAGYGVLDEFQQTFPDRFLNLGIAEQNTIGLAAGLALSGFKVFVYNIIPFVLYRCYEQVRNDVCYQNLPVTLIGTGSGVAYAPAGMTHYAVEDIGLARTLPGLAVLSPCDPVETRLCMEYAYRNTGPTYVRIAKGREPILHDPAPSSVSEPILVAPGEHIAVLFHGSAGGEVMAAIKELSTSPKVIALPLLQPLNWEKLREMLQGVHCAITVEEHYTEGGLGSIVAERLVASGMSLRLHRLGLPHAFVHDVRHSAGIRRAYGFAAPQIADYIRRIW